MCAAKVLRWERRPDARPQELLDAALSVFAERGYRNTRLEEVAEAAGVTKGTIYHYF
jgi:AcrR family transcriptional regulator